MHINVTPNNVHHSTFGDDDTIHAETCNMSIRNVLLMVFISGELCAHVSYYRVKNNRIYMGKYNSIAAIVKNGHHSGKGIMPLICDSYIIRYCSKTATLEYVVAECMTPLIFKIGSHVNNKELELISVIHILIDIARLLPFWTMAATIDNGMSRNISTF